MSNRSQEQAVRNYRRRLNERGLRRYEVLGRPEDQDLVRALARRLAENDENSARLRAELRRITGRRSAGKGGVLAVLRRSPLVGVELDIAREVTSGREVDL